MMRPDSIEQEVLQGFKSLSEVWSHIDISDSNCTRQIKDKICDIGILKGFKVYASQCAYEKNGAWLYDLCWAEETEKGEFVRLPLALESEWNRSTLSEDFQKLIVSKADHRVMVLWEKTIEAFKGRVEPLIEEAKYFKATQYGDRYLFLCWIEDDESFKSRLYVHGSV
jgi:hypothetical protein